ncbi:transposase [Acaryochloris sp. CCMEE 5410]|nr:transposase [Acaryochloris sp. CCMEE 5410]
MQDIWVKTFQSWENHPMWTWAYFASTAGQVSIETIKMYIESQGKN